METVATIVTILIILLTLFAVHHILKGDPGIKDKIEQARQQRRALAEQRARQDPNRSARPV